MIINHNMNAMNAHRNMATNTVTAGKSMEKLSSGLRINRAGDDAAGLSISEKMRGQIRGLEQASRNSQDGISLIQTTEGALNETHSILQRMRELSVQASNDTNTSEDKGQLSKEIKQLTDEIDRISQQTQFNKMDVLNGNGDEPFKANIQVGANSNQAIEISINKMDVESLLGRKQAVATGEIKDGDADKKIAVEADSKLKVKFVGDKAETEIALTEAKYDSKEEAMRGIANDIAKSDLAGKVTVQLDGSKLVFEAENLESLGAEKATELNIGTATLGKDTVKEIDLSSHSAATASITIIDRAIEKVSTQRSQLGAYQNRLEHTIKNVDNAAENLQAAESRVRDVDMANEMMTFSKNNILTQAAQAMLAQANQQPQGVLQLLR